MSRTARTASGTLTSFLQYGLQVILQITLAPLVLRAAGQETLGAYAILMQAIGYLALVDFGFAAAANRFMSQAYGKDDGGNLLRQVMSTFQSSAILINLLYAIGSILLAHWLGSLFSMPVAVRTQAQWGLYLMAIWVLLRTPLAIYGTALFATQNQAAANLAAILGNAARLLLSLGLVIAGMGLFGLMVAVVLADCLNYSLQTWIFLRRFPGIRPSWGFPNRILFREMFRFGSKAFILIISSRVILQSDNLVVGYLYGAAAASIYYATQLPAVSLQLMIAKLNDNSLPAVNELYARGMIDQLHRLFLQLHRYNWILILPAAFGFLFLSKPLIALWVGLPQYGGDMMVIALSLFTALYCLLSANRCFIIPTGRIGGLALFAVSEGVANLSLSLLLGHYWGLPGVIWATVIANIPTSIYQQWLCQKIFQVSIREYLREVIRPLLLPLTIGIITLIILMRAIPPNTWTALFIVIFIFSSIHMCLSYCFSLNNSDKLLLKSTVMSFIKLGHRSGITTDNI